MAKLIKRTDSFGTIRRYGGTPINALTARGLSPGKRKKKSATKLLAGATKTTDPKKSTELVKAAAGAKRGSRAATARMVGQNAIERARVAMERAQWRRANEK